MNIQKILILLYIITILEAQHGGGGGHSSGGHSGGGHSSGGGGSSSGGGIHPGGYHPYIPPSSGCSESDCPKLKELCDKKCSDLPESQEDKKKLCQQHCIDQYGEHNPPNFKLLGYLLGLGVGGSLAYFGCKRLMKKSLHHQFVKSHKSNMCQSNISQEELNQKFQQLDLNRRFRINFYQDGSKYSTNSFNIKGQKSSKSKGLFDITFESSDRVGAWNAKGYISITERGTSIWFEKMYKDRIAAGQTGRWKDLIYEGALEEGSLIFKGQWYYLEFKRDNIYSGMWHLQEDRN